MNVLHQKLCVLSVQLSKASHMQVKECIPQALMRGQRAGGGVWGLGCDRNRSGSCKSEARVQRGVFSSYLESKHTKAQRLCDPDGSR